MVQQRQNTSQVERPDVFRYHDYRVYLKDWLTYFRMSQSGLSLRDLANRCRLSPSYLSMVIAGSRKLTPKAMSALSPILSLNEEQRDHLRCLMLLADSDQADERQDAYRRMNRTLSYKKINPEENKTYEYFSHWYYVAIREMARTSGFKPDPEWIRERLRPRITTREVKQALEFLVTHGLIRVSPDGKTATNTEQLNCEGEVFRLALGRFHQEMFTLASNAIETVSTPERNILGYTLSVDEKKFQKIRSLLDLVQKKISEIAQEPGETDRVMQVELALFPLTERE